MEVCNGPRPLQCDIKATSMRVASQAVATSKPPQSHLQATLKPPSSHPQATFKPPSSHSIATLKPTSGPGNTVASHWWRRGLNPKAENRNPKEARNPKSEKEPGSSDCPLIAKVFPSSFGFRISFGFRFSGFGFEPRFAPLPGDLGLAHTAAHSYAILLLGADSRCAAGGRGLCAHATSLGPRCHFLHRGRRRAA